MKEEKMEHSPLPWSVENNDKFWIDDAAGLSVADLYHTGSRIIYHVRKMNDEANAQFIVTACNSYYNNQEEIADLKREIQMKEDAFEAWIEEHAEAKAAIAELVAALGKMQSVANNAFAAGTEEREYGSANRQGKLIDKYEAVLAEARALITKHKAVKP